MTPRLGLTVLLACLLCRAPVSAQEAYEIKVKEPAKGDYVARVHKLEHDHIKVVDNDGKVLQEKNERRPESYAYRETVLERPEGQTRPTHLKRHYDRAASGEDGKAFPYEGKTIVIAHKDGRYRFKIEGGADLDGDDAAALEKEFNKNKDDKTGLNRLLLPRQAVKVGEAWKVPVEAFVQMLEKTGGMTFDGDKATGTGKLLRVYKAEGRRYGVLDFRLELPLKSLKLEKDLAKVDEGARITLAVTLDLCIDGTRADFALSAAMHIKAAVPVPNPDQPVARLHLDVHHTTHASAKELAE